MGENVNEKRRGEIQKLTKLGHEYLSCDSPSDATESFLDAFQLSKILEDDYTLRGCRFNLGACYVATGKPKVGLKYLEQALPPDDFDDGRENFADLWYNIGIARHALNEINDAINAYKKAYDAYKEMATNKKLEAECLSKLAICYHLSNKLNESHEMYTKAHGIYKELNDRNNEALCLVSETAVLSQMGKIDECAKTLNVLLDVCQEVSDKYLQAKIYHDIGLLYISEKLYESAAECLEQALSCIDGTDTKEKHLQATLLQNIGAVCNYMKLYKKAIYFHQTSADMYGEIGDRKTQTQVFNNLAFAYTQMEKYSEAIIAFQHAIQASKDSGDSESHYLATEGMAAIWFRLKQYKRAVIYYKEAMRILTLSPDADGIHTDRIVNKLVDAIQYQLNEEGKILTHPDDKIDMDNVDGHHKGKSRFTDSFNKNRPLIAQGLDPDIADLSSSHENDESSVEDVDDGTVSIPSNNEKTKVPIHNQPQNLEETITSNYYEQPVTNLSPFVAEKTKINDKDDENLPYVKRTNSKMCLVM